VLVSTHPRTRKRLEIRAEKPRSLDGIIFHEPFGLFDYLKLQKSARCTLSDSGTISEESAILGFPSVTLRNSIERPEALDSGTIVMSALDEASVLDAIDLVTSNRMLPDYRCPTDYTVTDTSNRVVRYIISTWRQHQRWAGLRQATNV
jgi:UDP-N-acetyl-L-fucosamine synthase